MPGPITPSASKGAIRPSLGMALGVQQGGAPAWTPSVIATQYMDASGLSGSNWTAIVGNTATPTVTPPVLTLNVQNGYGGALYTGVEDMEFAIADSASWTIAAVWSTSNNAFSQRTLSTSSNSLIGPFGTKCEFYDGTFATGPVPTNNQFYIQIARHVSGIGANFVDGVSVGTTTGTQSLGTSIGIGALSSGVPQFRGYILSLVVCRSSLSNADEALLFNFWKAQFAL